LVPVLRFTEQAQRDLENISDYIARDNLTNALRFVDRLEARCRLHSLHPLLGRSRNDLRPGLRSFPFGRYVIFYRPLHDGIEVIRVLHGARDLRRALRDT
jgi:toxin ParE1/3/4